MDLRLMLPLAVLAVLTVVHSFVNAAARKRDAEYISLSENPAEAALTLVAKRSGLFTLGPESMFVPLVVITLTQTVSTAVLWVSWIVVALAAVATMNQHFLFRGIAQNNTVPNVLVFSTTLATLTLFPALTYLYGLSIYSAWRAL